MPPADALTLARRLLADLGRQFDVPLVERGWTVGLDRARRRLGACHPAKRRITLSASLSAALPDAVVEDTIRHEIAHAIDFERRGRSPHDATWRRIAVACGATPDRCYAADLPTDDSAPYAAVCPTCGDRHALYRQPVHPRRCPGCARAGAPAYLRVTRAAGGVIWPGGAEPGDYGGTAGVQATCPGCGTVHRRARAPRRTTACARCCRHHAGGRYDARFRLAFARP